MGCISRKTLRGWIVKGCLGSVMLTGCHPVDRFHAWRDSKNVSYYQEFVTRIEQPVETACMDSQIAETLNPFAVENPADLPAMELGLQDAIQMALQNSEVLRNIGGTVVSGPQGSPTQIDPALTDLNPLGGTQAALAAFDATVSSQLFWQKNDVPQNFSPQGLPPEIADLLGVFAFNQTLGTNINQIQKRTATGATYSLRSNVIYDRNNRPNRKYESDFSGFLEAEYRQPLMQGAGTTFNRIAGPGGIVGQYNGVLIARINTDISLADFENGVIRLINDVETAYWELYFTYRNLEAQISGRENALRTWQRIRELQKVGYRGGEADAEAQARSNYYLFASQLNDALSGPNGMYAAEQRLRYMIGYPATDGRLLKPVDDPIQAEVMFDWQASLADATNRRVEVRRQEWTIKRRELELIASRLNKRPRLDALTRYRYRGLGDHLFGARNPAESTDSFFSNLGTGDYQEWQGGFEWTYNVGLRQASAAVRHAQLNLAREVAVLKEQQLRISHDLSNAARQISRSYEQMQINYNRIEADKLQVEVLRNRYEKGLININFLLQAQQQLANSTSAFFRSLVDYNLAIRDFHREKGSLLNYNQVALSEEPLNGSMLSGAYERGRYFTPRDNPQEVIVRDRISAGPFDPSTVGTPGVASGVVETIESAPPAEIVEPSARAPGVPATGRETTLEQIVEPVRAPLPK